MSTNWDEQVRNGIERSKVEATRRLAAATGREADAQSRQAAALERIATVLESLFPAPRPTTEGGSSADEH